MTSIPEIWFQFMKLDLLVKIRPHVFPRYCFFVVVVCLLGYFFKVCAYLCT